MGVVWVFTDIIVTWFKGAGVGVRVMGRVCCKVRVGSSVPC